VQAGDGGDEERIRKVYARDLKGGETVQTVFKATHKERHTSRAGKTYLSLTLVDRTGEVDARIFENVDTADTAVADGDYLLVDGKVGSFHGKSQIVIEKLERLDPEPIDPAEFAWDPPPAPPEAPAKEVKEAREKEPERERPVKKPLPEEPPAATGPVPVRVPRRLQKLLEQPQMAQALEALLGYVERLVEERVAIRLGEKPPDRPEKRVRGPRVEHRALRTEAEKPEARPEVKRDPSLPEGLAFKPFKALIGEDAAAPTPPEAKDP
jgi:hypothetical protein